MGWIQTLLGSSTNKPYIARRDGIDVLVFPSPRIGFLNLLGEAAETMIADDRMAFESQFATEDELHGTGIPNCDILMIYCVVESDGRIRGTRDGLGDIMRRSRACIVMVASENPLEHYSIAANSAGDFHANLVLTLSRNGTAFVRFFSQLFTLMMRGTSMPFAWISLAPQAPTAEHTDCPSTLFMCAAGHVAFK